MMQKRSSQMRELTWILIVKLLALGMIWLFWFSSPPNLQPWPGAGFLAEQTTPR
jgi:hypothetical protein